MYGPDGPDTFWLNFTNIALGLVTLLCPPPSFGLGVGITCRTAGHGRARESLSIASSSGTSAI